MVLMREVELVLREGAFDIVRAGSGVGGDVDVFRIQCICGGVKMSGAVGSDVSCLFTEGSWWGTRDGHARGEGKRLGASSTILHFMHP